MTAHTDPNRIFMEEIAALRRELAETRRELAHVIAAMKRQDDSQRELGRGMQLLKKETETNADRIGVVRDILMDWILNIKSETNELLPWLEEAVRDLDMWVTELAWQKFPRAWLFGQRELPRLFPRGCGMLRISGPKGRRPDPG